LHQRLDPVKAMTRRAFQQPQLPEEVAKKGLSP